MHCAFRFFSRTVLPVLLFAGMGTKAAQAQDVQPWTFDYKKGDMSKFRTFLRVNGRAADDTGDIKIALMSVSQHEVKDVSAEGDYTYMQTDLVREVKFNGMPFVVKSDDIKPVQIISRKNGTNAKRMDAAGVPVSQFEEKLILLLQALPVPTAAVKPGDAWKVDVANPIIKNKTVVVTSTYVGMEKILGIDALKIKLAFEAPQYPGASPDETINLRETYWLDAKTHRLLRSTMTIKNPMMPIPGKKFEARVLVTAIIPGMNEKEEADVEKLLAMDNK